MTKSYPYLLLILITALLMALFIFLAKPSKSLTTEDTVVSDDLLDLNAAASPSREDWKFPLWAKFKNWLIGFGAAAGLVIAFLYGVYLYQIYSRPNATPTTQPAIPVGVTPPAPAAPPKTKLNAKTTTKKQAQQPINTPAIAINSPEITPSAAPAEIAIKPSQQPATRGPERPLPPSPPFPPLPPN